MLRFFILFLLAMLLPAEASAADARPPSPVQEDLIVGLVEALGWSYGLPDKPEIDDYLAILNGRRTWRFEFEEVYVPDPDAPVAPKEILTFGEFSGQFWQRAPAHDISTELAFLLPVSGRYEIRAALHHPGFRLRIGDADFVADGADRFSEVVFGTVDLAAGPQSATLTIPARGGVDYLLLTAPPRPPVAPLDGWDIDKALTAADLAVVAVRALDLEPALPAAGTEIVLEAEAAPVPEHATLSDDIYQGPMHDSWVRVGLQPVMFSHLFEIKREGVYDIHLNALGRTPLEGTINQRGFFVIEPEPYFSEMPAGSFYLEQGINQLDLTLPPRSGLDRIRFARRASDPEDFIRLTGLEKSGRVTTEQLDRVLRLLAAIGAAR